MADVPVSVKVDIVYPPHWQRMMEAAQKMVAEGWGTPEIAAEVLMEFVKIETR